MRHNDHPGQRLRPSQLSICVENTQPRYEGLRIAAPVRMMSPHELPAAPLSIFHLCVHPPRAAPVRLRAASSAAISGPDPRTSAAAGPSEARNGDALHYYAAANGGRGAPGKVKSP